MHILVIEIDRDLKPEKANETLIHEWAHAASWDQPGRHHGKNWGIAYARRYRVCFEEAGSKKP